MAKYQPTEPTTVPRLFREKSTGLIAALRIQIVAGASSLCFHNHDRRFRRQQH